MSKTLFWYVFKDLLKVFLMASGALAGIMSFGGLLRPLTQHGLDGEQVIKLLTYFMPAMSTYSVPVAALFATTIVYGRMAADNEITACRASGISMGLLGLTLPAALLGVLVAMLSMGLLCFTVPAATKKVEKIIYSNLAKLIANEISQTHETHFGSYTIFAQRAELPPLDPKRPNDQSVALKGPLIVSYATPPGKDRWFHVAKQFWMASEAIAYIHEDPGDSSATLRATLVNGVTFPRRFTGPKNDQGGLGRAVFGPYTIPSRLGQKTKFMNIFELEQLEQHPTRALAVQDVLMQFVRDDQAGAYRKRLVGQLSGPGGECLFDSGEDHYTLSRAGAVVADNGSAVTLTARPGGSSIEFRQRSGGRVQLTVDARAATISVDPDTEHDQMNVSLEMKDALVDAGDMPSPKQSFPRQFTVAMPPAIAAIKGQTAVQALSDSARSQSERDKLLTTLVDIINRVQGEINARAAFVVSCLLLVLVGAALGMMFKSGNFLTAFAVSVLPAMLSTVLIVTGQHTVENTPLVITAFNNPLVTGLELIWTGNVFIFVASVVLLWRLRRQ